MTVITSTHHLKIAREIDSFNDYKIAKFYYGDSDDLLCSAWYAMPDVRKISTYQDWTGIERASALSIAINMAIEWLTEQQ